MYARRVSPKANTFSTAWNARSTSTTDASTHTSTRKRRSSEWPKQPSSETARSNGSRTNPNEDLRTLQPSISDVMLITLDARSEGDKFPTSALDEMDEIMSKMGCVREARTVIEWGKSYSTSYEGPDLDNSKIQESITPLAAKYSLKINVDKEESHHFP